MTSTFITYLGGLADQVGRDERSELQAKILHVNPAVPLNDLPVKLRRPGVALHPLSQTEAGKRSDYIDLRTRKLMRLYFEVQEFFARAKMGKYL